MLRSEDLDHIGAEILDDFLIRLPEFADLLLYAFYEACKAGTLGPVPSVVDRVVGDSRFLHLFPGNLADSVDPGFIAGRN